MPPRSRAGRKGSIAAAKDAAPAPSKDAKSTAAGSMAPPPDPLPPVRILEPEVTALSTCLKNAVVKTGQLYRFYSDTNKLGIQRHAPNPPHSLVASVGREIEKYDQLCDAIDSQLLRALAVLRRDLAREERRIEDAKTAAISTRTRSKSVSSSPTSNRMALPAFQPLAVDTSDNTQPSSTAGEPSAPATAISATVPLGRRPSAISISSLQRPPVPLKLDLSSASLRIPVEDTSLFSGGLSSPVTLAPRSARPSEIIPDLMAAFTTSPTDTDPTNRPIDIDLTVPDIGAVDISAAGNDVDINMDTALGSSADKPIELDLDMTDLFGDPTGGGVDGLFSPPTETPMVDTTMGSKPDKDGDLGIEILDALSAVGGMGGGEDMFASLGAPVHNAMHVSESLADPQSLHVPALPTDPSSLSTSTITAPSPGSLLASLQAASNETGGTDGQVSDTPFDLLDLTSLSPNFFSHTTGTEDISLMEELFNMSGVEASTIDEASKNQL